MSRLSDRRFRDALLLLCCAACASDSAAERRQREIAAAERLYAEREAAEKQQRAAEQAAAEAARTIQAAREAAQPEQYTKPPPVAPVAQEPVARTVVPRGPAARIENVTDESDDWADSYDPIPEAVFVPLPRQAPVLEERPARGPEFRVDFGGPTRPVPPGVVTGVNDYNNTDPGVWAAYADALRPQGGLVRLWLRQARELLGQRHLRAAQMANDAGLSVLLCCKGSASDFDPSLGKYREANARPPRDSAAWSREIAQAVKSMLDQGLRVSHVEIWNEPDLVPHWGGTGEEFAEFFARAGKALRERLPPEVKVGGCGMARGWGGGLKLFARMLERCEETGFVPDFLSWHHYTGYPSDAEAFLQAGRARGLFARRGWSEPEIILSEWNIGLPGQSGRKAALDDHRAAVHYVAEATSLFHAGFDYSTFHMLQDTDSHAGKDYKDYAGNDVGIFTLHGGPKAVLSGMRMMRQASELPAVPVERVSAPWNLTLLATRGGDRGYLLAANATGSEDKRARKVLDVLGVDFSEFQKGSAEKTREYLKGNLDYERLGYPETRRSAWEKARSLIQEGLRESKDRSREVTIELADAPGSIRRVWLLDSEHGNPARDPAFMKAFERAQTSVHERAVKEAVAEMGKARMSAEQLADVQRVLEKQDRELARQKFDRLTVARIETAYRNACARVEESIPLDLARHPAARAAVIEPGKRVRLRGGELTLALPPYTAILVELSWQPGSR